VETEPQQDLVAELPITAMHTIRADLDLPQMQRLTPQLSRVKQVSLAATLTKVDQVLVGQVHQVVALEETQTSTLQELV
jgi:hypothetical protein